MPKRSPPFKYHIILRKIYENFGLEWFRFRQLWDLRVLQNESGASARSKMGDMCGYDYDRKEKLFLDKVKYNQVEHLFLNANKYVKISMFWRVNNIGLRELATVYNDLEFRKEHIPIIAKMLLR